MKKIFTLLAGILLACGVNAETLINFPTSQEGITVSGTTEFATVKIHNADPINGIKFGNSYMKDGALNDNYAKLTVEGGFKAGDVITIAGAFNNSDNSKQAAADIFIINPTVAAPEVLFTTQQFINGKDKEADPIEETYVLTSDVDELYIGRNGNTATFVTTLKVVRGEESAEVPNDPTPATVWNFAAELSSNDAANLAADAANWAFDSDKEFWYSTGMLTDRNVFAEIKANGAILELTQGIEITRDHAEALKDKIRIASGKYFAINGGGVMMKFKDLSMNDLIRLRVKGAGVSERTINITSGKDTYEIANQTEVNMNGETVTAEFEAEYTVAHNGDLIITPSNGFQFMAIAINSTLPEKTETGIETVKTNTTEGTAMYNLAGQKVAEGYKGVVIMNGKKVVK